MDERTVKPVVPCAKCGGTKRLKPKARNRYGDCATCTNAARALRRARERALNMTGVTILWRI